MTCWSDYKYNNCIISSTLRFNMCIKNFLGHSPVWLMLLRPCRCTYIRAQVTLINIPIRKFVHSQYFCVVFSFVYECSCMNGLRSLVRCVSLNVIPMANYPLSYYPWFGLVWTHVPHVFESKICLCSWMLSSECMSVIRTRFSTFQVLYSINNTQPSNIVSASWLYRELGLPW